MFTDDLTKYLVERSKYGLHMSILSTCSDLNI